MPMLFSEHQAALFEGKQAEEYLQRKRDEYLKKNHDDSKYTRQGKRATDEEGADRYNNTFTPTTNKNPSYKSGHELRSHRSKYNDVMPKETKSEKKLKDAESKEKASRVKASDIADKEISKRNKNNGGYKSNEYYTGHDNSDPEEITYNKMTDAIRRHERRHPTKESFGIFAEMVDTDEPTQYGDQMTRDDLVPDDEICNGIQHQYNGIEKTGNGIDDNGAPVDESYGIFEPMMEGKLKDLDKKLRDNKSKQASDDDPFNGKYNVISPDGSRTDKFGSMKRRFEVGPYATDWKTPSEKHIKKAYDKKRKEYGYV